MNASNAVQVTGIARRFGRRWALARVDLEVPGGGALMLTGANGSGKSTLLRCLATALRPHEGGASLGGRDLWAERASLRPHIGYLAHQLHVWDDLSPSENLSAWARLGGLTAEPAVLLERVGLDPRRRDPVRALSAGMKRRLALARLLLKQPRLILLDEPFSALDPDGRDLLVDVIRELREGGATLLLATHLPAIGHALCDRAITLEGGRKLWEGATADLLAGAT